MGKEDIQDTRQTKGIKAMLDQSRNLYSKMPIFEMIFEKFKEHITHSLRQLTAENISVKINKINSTRFSDYIDTIKTHSAIGIMQSQHLKNYSLITIEHNLLFLLIDVLLGGKASYHNKVDRGKLTYIEQAMTKELTENMISQLNNAFKSIYDTNFVFEKLESKPHFVTIARGEESVMHASLNIDIDNRGGTVDIVLPYKALEPMQGNLHNAFMPNSVSIDDCWHNTMKDALDSIDMPIEAVIRSQSSIYEVAKFHKGSVFVLNRQEDDNVEVMTGGLKIGEGKLGKQSNKVAIHMLQLNNEVETA